MQDLVDNFIQAEGVESIAFYTALVTIIPALPAYTYIVELSMCAPLRAVYTTVLRTSLLKIWVSWCFIYCQ